jgi:hypothetical protein
MYYTTIPLVSERQNNRRWDAAKLRELRKRLDSGTMTVDEIDQVAADFLDGEIVDLASDWLGNTVSAIGSESGCTNLNPTLGCSETFREMLSWASLYDARTYCAPPRHDWYPQERDMGCAEDHRMCYKPGGSCCHCPEFASVCSSSSIGPIWQLRRPVCMIPYQ